MRMDVATTSTYVNQAYSPSEGGTDDDVSQTVSNDQLTQRSMAQTQRSTDQTQRSTDQTERSTGETQRSTDQTERSTGQTDIKKNLTLESTKIWASFKSTETKIEKYKKFLEKVKDNHEQLKTEVVLSCCDDQLIRFELCHDILKKRPELKHSHVDFNYEEFGNMLFLALWKEAWRVTRFLLKTVDPEFISWASKIGKSEGMTALHLVVMKNRRDILEDMMQRLKPDDRKILIARRVKGDICGGHFKYCNNPTTFALYCGHLEMFFDLIRFGGDVMRLDKYKDYPVHILIEYGRMYPDKACEFLNEILTSPVTISWYCAKKEIPEDQITQRERIEMKSQLLKVRNPDGYTALTYSAKMGVLPVLVYILNCEGVYKHTQWSFGGRSCARYDMSEVDPSVVSLLDQYKQVDSNKKSLQNIPSPSVLELLVYENGDRDLPTLSDQPLRQLVKTKWRQHRVQYTLMAAFHFVVLCLQTTIAVTIATHNNGNDSISTQPDYGDIDDDIYGFVLIQLGILAISVIICLYGIMELYEVCHALWLFIWGRLLWQPDDEQYYVPWSIVLKLDEFDVFMMVYCSASLAWLPRLFDDTYIGDGLALSIALVSGWYFMLFYTRAYKPTSFFNVMLSRMLFSDLIRFVVAMGLLLVGFGVSLMVLVGQPLPDDLSSMGNTIVTMILLMVGMADLGYIENAKHPKFATAFSLIYVVLGTVLLLNMLIAVLADTYNECSESRENLWLKMRVRSVLVTERRSLKWFLRWRLSHMDEYMYIKKKWFIEVEDAPVSKKERGLFRSCLR